MCHKFLSILRKKKILLPFTDEVVGKKQQFFAIYKILFSLSRSRSLAGFGVQRKTLRQKKRLWRRIIYWFSETKTLPLKAFKNKLQVSENFGERGVKYINVRFNDDNNINIFYSNFLIALCSNSNEPFTIHLGFNSPFFTITLYFGLLMS